MFCRICLCPQHTQFADLTLHKRAAHVVVFKIIIKRTKKTGLCWVHIPSLILKAQKSTKGVLESENH